MLDQLRETRRALREEKVEIDEIRLRYRENGGSPLQRSTSPRAARRAAHGDEGPLLGGVPSGHREGAGPLEDEIRMLWTELKHQKALLEGREGGGADGADGGRRRLEWGQGAGNGETPVSSARLEEHELEHGWGRGLGLQPGVAGRGDGPSLVTSASAAAGGDSEKVAQLRAENDALRARLEVAEKLADSERQSNAELREAEVRRSPMQIPDGVDPQTYGLLVREVEQLRAQQAEEDAHRLRLEEAYESRIGKLERAANEERLHRERMASAYEDRLKEARESPSKRAADEAHRLRQVREFEARIQELQGNLEEERERRAKLEASFEERLSATSSQTAPKVDVKALEGELEAVERQRDKVIISYKALAKEAKEAYKKYEERIESMQSAFRGLQDHFNQMVKEYEGNETTLRRSLDLEREARKASESAVQSVKEDMVKCVAESRATWEENRMLANEVSSVLGLDVGRTYTTKELVAELAKVSETLSAQIAGPKATMGTEKLYQAVVELRGKEDSVDRAVAWVKRVYLGAQRTLKAVQSLGRQSDALYAFNSFSSRLYEEADDFIS